MYSPQWSRHLNLIHPYDIQSEMTNEKPSFFHSKKKSEYNQIRIQQIFWYLGLLV